uniref:Uncharacterized protein n=1 Tax=Eubacterium cellulosolvens (strain ATCC 43171 / JCM 9499 / 6) TaxID=633697 RepID=I5AQF4_EUBC6
MKKVNIWISLTAVVVLLGAFFCGYNRFGLFRSLEYYKGFDWATTSQRLESRLKKGYQKKNTDEYKMYYTNEWYPDEYPGTWCQESYCVDNKTGYLKEVNILFATRDSKSMNLVYSTEIKKITSKIGKGIEYEDRNHQYTEWIGKRSTIRVIKNDYEYEDSNDAVQIVYLDKKNMKPFFTEKHLSESVFKLMIEKFYCEPSPAYDEKSLDLTNESDYSYFKLRKTEETYKAVAVMNKYLFGEDQNGSARIVADAEGLSEDHPMTVEWIMQHPVRASKLWDEVVGYTNKDDFLANKEVLDKEYSFLTEEEKHRA